MLVTGFYTLIFSAGCTQPWQHSKWLKGDCCFLRGAIMMDAVVKQAPSLITFQHPPKEKQNSQ